MATINLNGVAFSRGQRFLPNKLYLMPGANGTISLEVPSKRQRMGGHHPLLLSLEPYQAIQMGTSLIEMANKRLNGAQRCQR